MSIPGTRPVAAAVLAAALACGCGSSSPSPTQPSPAPAAAEPTPPPGPEQGREVCRRMFERQRVCTDTYIPALVDLRIELDVPAGIAAAAAEKGRDALIGQALEEWERDSTDEAIGQTCDQIVGSIPAEQLGPMLEAGTGCLEQGSCVDFVACASDLQRGHLAAQKAAAAPAPAPAP